MKNKWIFSVLAFTLVLNISVLVFSQDEKLLKLKPGEPIVVDGDKVEYFEHEKRIVAEGNVSIKYDDVTLFCDRIEVNTELQQAVCKGNVRIEHPGGVLEGDEIAYDLLNKKGGIVGAGVKAFPWFGEAEETRKEGDNEYILNKGQISTCDLDKPHYRVSAEKIQVFPNDKIIAKNAVFYVGDVPVMWFPYYYHPIIQTKAKVQLVPGFSSDWGYFLLSAWRFHIKGNTKMDVLLDYRTKKGLAEGANVYYNLDDFNTTGLGEGLFRVYYTHQNDRLAYQPAPFRGEDDGPQPRSRIQWAHRIDFDPQTVGMVELNGFSDEHVIQDYFFNEYEENNVVPQNYVSVITAQPNFMASIELVKRFDDFFTVTQKLPELKLEIPDQRLGETSFYYSSDMSATVFDKQYAGESKPPETVKRIDSFHKFSYVSKIGFLNVTPYGTFRETFYNHNIWDEEYIARNIFGGGIDTFARFHRIFDYETDFMDLDINGLRHIIVPSAGFFHNHQPSVDKDSLFQMDEIDALEKENGIKLSLENKLQTKRGEGLSPVDLVRFIAGTNYLFRMEKGEFGLKDDGKFTDIDLDLEIKPYDWLFIDGDMKIAPKDQAIKTGNVEFALYPNDKFRVDFGYRYEKRDDNDARNRLTYDVFYVLNPKWRFEWYERFDLHNGRIDEQQYIITRDLHCWEVELAYDIEGENPFKDEYTIWVAFKIKAFPDLQLGLSRGYTKHTPGSSLNQ